jgi:hypothetical protein
MNEKRWLWPLVAIAALLILASTVRSGGWVSLAAGALTVGGVYALTKMGESRGYEWRIPRGTGLVALPVMLVVFLGVSSATGSAGLASVLALATIAFRVAPTSTKGRQSRTLIACAIAERRLVQHDDHGQ